MPQIVESSEEFEIKAEFEKCWSFFLDLGNIASCIPGYESMTKLGSTTAKIKVKLKIGYLSRAFEITAKLQDVEKPNHLSFTGEGSDAEIFGALDFSRGTDSIALRYRIEIRPISVIGKTAIAMIGNDLVRKQASEFASCVKSRLEA